MDWQERLRRNRLSIQADSQNRFANISAALDRTTGPGNSGTTHEDPGFIGAITGIGKGIYDIGKGAVDLVGNAIGDVMESAGTVVEGAGAAVGGLTSGDGGKAIMDKRAAERKQLFAKDINEGWTNDASVAKANEFDKETKRLIDPAMKQQQAATSRLNKVDATKTAAAAADTFLNVATAGGAGTVKDLAFSAAKQGGRALARNVTKTAAKDVATSAATRLGRDMFEGAAVGGVQGGLSQLRQNGSNAKAGDIATAALMGGALSGAMSGGMKIALDKGVRKALPGMVNGGIDAVTGRNLPRAIREGGSVPAGTFTFGQDLGKFSTPFDLPTDAATKALPAPKAPAAEDINLSTFTAARRQKVESQINNGTIDINSFTPTEKKLIRNEVDSLIYKNDPTLAAHMEGANSLDMLSTNRAGGDFTMPMLTRQEVIGQFGKADKGAWPLKYTTKKSSTRSGLDVQAAENGFDDVGEYLDHAQQIMAAKVTNKTSNQALAAARKNPEYINQAVNSLIVDRPKVPNEIPLTPGYDAPGAVQASLGRMESQTNPWVDSVTAPPVPTTPGIQQAVDLPQTNPYAGWEQNLNRPALGPGNTGPVNMTRLQAKTASANGTMPENYTIAAKGSKKAATILPADSTTLGDVAVRTTPGGKVVPVATNNAHLSKDEASAWERVLKEGNPAAATTTRTSDMNMEEMTVPIKDGGKTFSEINRYNVETRAADAASTRIAEERFAPLRQILTDGNITKKQAEGSWDFLQSVDAKTDTESLLAFTKEHGEAAAATLVKARDYWRSINPAIRDSFNTTVEKYAGKDRMAGDQGLGYVPHYNKKTGLMDTVQSGLTGFKGFMNVDNAAGSRSIGIDTVGGNLNTATRGVNQAPMGSEFAAPNTSFVQSSLERKGNIPLKQRLNPYEAMFQYTNAMTRADNMTPIIAKGRTIEKFLKEKGTELGTGRQLLDRMHDQVNAVAGKTHRFDQLIVNTESGQKVGKVLTTVQRNVSKSTILGSVTSAVAQTGQLPLLVAENGPKNFAKGLSDLFKYIGKDSSTSPLGSSDFMASRYPANDGFIIGTMKQAGKKASDVITKPFHLIEKSATEVAWYSSYNRVLGEGLTGKEAIQQADRLTAKVVGERTPGQMAMLYESKLATPVTAYTLEVNQMYQVAKQYFKRDPKKAAMLVGAIWLYNSGYQAATGNKLNADPLDAVMSAGKTMTDSSLTNSDGTSMGFLDRFTKASGRIAGTVIDATPLGGQIAGQLYPEKGFAVPFTNGQKMLTRADVFGNSNFGRYGGGMPIASGIANPILLAGIPGMAQAQKSFVGVGAYNKGVSETPAGNTRFTIQHSPDEFVRALLLGQYGTGAGRDYLAQRNANLGIN